MLSIVTTKIQNAQLLNRIINVYWFISLSTIWFIYMCIYIDQLNIFVICVRALAHDVISIDLKWVANQIINVNPCYRLILGNTEILLIRTRRGFIEIACEPFGYGWWSDITEAFKIKLIAMDINSSKYNPSDGTPLVTLHGHIIFTLRDRTAFHSKRLQLINCVIKSIWKIQISL